MKSVSQAMLVKRRRRPIPSDIVTVVNPPGSSVVRVENRRNIDVSGVQRDWLRLS